MFFHIRADAQRVLDRAQGEHLSQPHARQARLGGFGARGEQQLVVGLLKHRAGLEVLHRNRLAVRVDGRHLVPHAHIHPEAGVKALGRLQRQLRRVLDHAADVIRQAAVGIGNIVRPLEHHDLRHLIQSADAGRRRGPAGYAAYDNNFHAYCSTFLLHDRFSIPSGHRKAALSRVSTAGKGRLCRASVPIALTYAVERLSFQTGGAPRPRFASGKSAGCRRTPPGARVISLRNRPRSPSCAKPPAHRRYPRDCQAACASAPCPLPSPG